MNKYYQVNRRHTLSVYTGQYRATNEWYGNCNIHKAIVRPATLDTTWQVHKLVGGTFAVKGNAVMEISEKSLVPDCLTEIPKPAKTPQYRD